MKYNFRIYILAIVCFILPSAKAQKQADWWYFGDYAGVHFVNGVPKGVTNGKCYTYEGCAVVSDANGNLLMYTDGSNVWNSNHQTMQNGTGLLGDFSATQSGVIVPKPGSKNIHYVFSVDAYPGTDGLHYSIVDMSYNSGLGKVTTKNNALGSDLLEKLSAVRHANGTDFWVMGLSNSEDSIYTYLVNSSGVNSTPVVSYSGGNTSNSVCLGYLKVSPDGTKIAYCQTGLNSLYYGNFDASTGKCNNMTKLDSIPDCYGLEFSASSNKLYADNNSGLIDGNIYQYSLESGSISQIKKSKKIIYTTTNYLMAALQLGPNGNIYVTRAGAKVLGELSFADSTYPTCKYKWNAVDLKGRQTFDGLPTFIQSYFLQVKFNYSDLCLLNTTKFSVVDSSKIDSVLWVFGDSSTGSNDSSIAMSAEHQFSKAGNYKVSLYYWNDSIAYSSFKNITIDSIPISALPKDTFICGTTKTNLSVPKKENYFYMWSTGDTVNNILVDTPGIYWLEISNECGSIRDSVTVVKYDKPIVSLGNDTTYCDTFSRTFDVTNKSCKYLWSTGDTIPQITIKKFGIYWVKVSNICFTIYDSIKIDSLSIPKPKLGNDTLYCGSFSRKFNVLQKFCSYLWNTGDTVSSFTINSKGTYIINIANLCGVGIDTINIDNMLQVGAYLGKDTVYCKSKTILLDAKNVVTNPYISKNRYVWSTGDTTQTIQVQPIGAIWVKVYNTCFTSYDTVSIILKSIPNPNLGNDTFTCNTVSYNINVAHPYSSYLWSTGDTNSTFGITQPGMYWVKVYNECGSNADTFNIRKVIVPSITLETDTFYCTTFDQKLDATFAGAKYKWSTGDTVPVIHAANTGMYSVNVSNECGSVSDSINIILYNPPIVSLGNDTVFCSNFNKKLSVYNPFCNYTWSTGDTLSNIMVNKEGIYYVNVYNQCWQKSDTINIEQPNSPKVNLGNDTIYCGLFNRDFDVTSNKGDRYIWNTTDTAPLFHINTPNTYSVKIYNTCFSATDSIVINQLFNPQINLGNDTVFCNDFIYTIDPQNSSYKYIWSTGDTTSSITITTTGNYWAEASNYCGAQRDSIAINRVYRPTFLDLGNDTTICFNTSLYLTQNFGNLAHNWNNGDTTNTIIITKPGTYWTRVTDQACNYLDTIKVSSFPHRVLNLGDDKTLCMDQHDTVVLQGGKYILYNWQPGNFTTDSIQVITPGLYTLIVTDTFGCSQSDSMQVVEICPPKIWLPNAFTPGHKDTLNDVFKPITFMVDSYTLDIYSRWGEHIYSGTEKDEGWDGTYKGVNCGSDIYIWMVKYDSHLLPKDIMGGNTSGVVYIIR